MDQLLPDRFDNMPIDERKRFLANNADETIHDEVVTTIVKGEEKDSYRTEFVEESLKLSRLEDQKKKMLDEFKEEMAPHKERIKELTKVLKLGQREITTDVYLFRDHEEGRVYTVLPSGEIIDDRRMLDHERQSTIQGGMRSVK